MSEADLIELGLKEPEEKDDAESGEDTTKYEENARTSSKQRYNHRQHTRQDYYKRKREKSPRNRHISRQGAEKDDKVKKMMVEAEDQRRSGWHFENHSMVRWQDGKKMVDTIRRVVRVGGCLCITLPAPWVRYNRVRLGDTIIARIALNQRAPRRRGY